MGGAKEVKSFFFFLSQRCHRSPAPPSIFFFYKKKKKKKKKKKTRPLLDHFSTSAAAARLALTGRVLGISGIAGGVARGQLDAPRVAFTAGLLGAGAALALPASSFLPPALSSSSTLLQALPAASYSATRAVAAGALVGAGSALGGGCTSGHGICGNARLSARSAAFTAVMMATGAAAAGASGARAAVGLSSPAAAAAAFSIAPYAAPAAGTVASGLALFAVAVGAFALLALAGKRAAEGEAKSKKLVELAAEFSIGLFFSLGLGLSGMLRPAKVIAFLTPFGGGGGGGGGAGGGGGWDPSLALVMGSALAVSVPVVQRVLLGKKNRNGDKPACSASFSLPTKTAVDARLLAGAAVFGAGWGLGGICPGPGLVSAAAGGGGLYLAWCAAFLAAHALTSSVAAS